MNEAVEVEEFGLDDLIAAEEKEAKKEQAEAEKPDDSELEQARAFAEKINSVFLFGVNKVVCPSVEDIDSIVDREAGNEALTPLALQMGGSAPAWMVEFLEKYDPYLKAGIYMGTTIYTVKKIENHLRAEAEKEQTEAGQDGEK